MLVILLFISRVGCEWVEISQQHYRKPVSITQNYPTENSEDSRQTYTNHSISEYNWNKGAVHRVPNLGNVKRVQIPISNARPIVKHTIDTDRNGFGSLGFDKERIRNVDMVGSVKRVSNIGKVNRVQLADTPVKSPTVKVQPDVNQGESPSIVSQVKIEDKVTQNINNEKEGANDESNIGYKNQISTEKIPMLITQKEDTKILTRNPEFTSDDKIKYEIKNFTRIKYPNEPIPTFVTSSDEVDYNDHFNHGVYDMKTKVKAPSDIDIRHAIETTEFKVREKITSEIQSQSRIKNKNAQIPNFLIKKILAEDDTTNHELEHGTSFNTRTTQDNPNSKLLEEKHNKNQFNDGVNDAQKQIDLDVSGNTKSNTINTLVKFLRIVSDTISENTRRNFNGKMRYLQELKDTIMANIEDRIESTWPDDDEEPSRRRSRSTRDTARGHVEFPSSENALMTLSFLTFAVFLIKLVLQVIQTYKDKTMMVAPLVVASAGRAARKQLQTKH